MRAPLPLVSLIPSAMTIKKAREIRCFFARLALAYDSILSVMIDSKIVISVIRFAQSIG